MKFELMFFICLMGSHQITLYKFVSTGNIIKFNKLLIKFLIILNKIPL